MPDKRRSVYIHKEADTWEAHSRGQYIPIDPDAVSRFVETIAAPFAEDDGGTLIIELWIERPAKPSGAHYTPKALLSEWEAAGERT